MCKTSTTIIYTTALHVLLYVLVALTDITVCIIIFTQKIDMRRNAKREKFKSTPKKKKKKKSYKKICKKKNSI